MFAQETVFIYFNFVLSKDFLFGFYLIDSIIAIVKNAIVVP